MSGTEQAVPVPSVEPAYRALHRQGQLFERARRPSTVSTIATSARATAASTARSIKGAVCRTGQRARVAASGPHHGEEEPLLGRRGSGTIFFTWCNLRCVYCQNWEISQRGAGQEVARRANSPG